MRADRIELFLLAKALRFFRLQIVDAICDVTSFENVLVLITRRGLISVDFLGYDMISDNAFLVRRTQTARPFRVFW